MSKHRSTFRPTLRSTVEPVAQHSIAAAVVAGCQAHPDVAAGAVIASLTASLGPVIQQIINLIEQGATSLPAILAALQAAGVNLPSWVNLVITLLLALVPKPTSGA